MIYGYIRVSTDDQDTQNQKFEIETFCKKNKIKINAWCEEKISGTKNFKKGKFGDFIKKSKKGDLIICSEISRLSRDMLILMKILEHCLTNDIQIWTIKDNFRLENNLQSKVLAFAFGMAAEIERTLIAQRTKEALKLRKASGMKLGRQAGSKNKNCKLDDKKNLILKYIKKGIPQRDMAKKLNVSVPTLSKFIRKNNEEFKKQ